MKRQIILSSLLMILALPLWSGEWKPSEWRFLRHYDAQHLYSIALPLGGIGTGTVSLGGRGELRDWEIMNVPAIGYGTVKISNDAPLFVIHVEPDGGEPMSSMLSGPIDKWEYAESEGNPVYSHGFPRFKNASFDAAYPYGQVNLSDPNMPLTVKIKGFNPFIPGDVDASSLPVAVITYEVTNTSDRTEEVSICGNFKNFVGKDGSKYNIDWTGKKQYFGSKDNRNDFRTSGDVKGIFFYSDGVDKNDPAWGTMALSTCTNGDVTYSLSSGGTNSWNTEILSFWDDFSADGEMTAKPFRGEDCPMASLSVKKKIGPHQKATFTFYITWNFPNRKAWSSTVVGNYYSTLYEDAWDAALKIIPQIPELERRTVAFVNAFLDSTYPDEVKEAALFNLSVLRSQTVFRLPDGHMMGWEGVHDGVGSCYGSCTHVWNYETATAFLFGDLAKSMRDVEFNYATRPNGLMNFRAALPLSEAAKNNMAAADGQMGTIMKFYREWQLSGDDDFLIDNWAKVKSVMSYAWEQGSWDSDADGIMEGSQHNTMDVNYWGPNGQMQFWYMGALRASEEMAEFVKDKEFAKKCRKIYKAASSWTEDNLFNGEYYEQKITDPGTRQFVDMNDPKSDTIDFQLGRCCLVDQLVGQYMAHICGLGYLGDREHAKTALQSVMKYNWVDDFTYHFNNMRSFVLGDESGLVMGSFPRGRLKFPFPYFNESMTGFEYCAAVGMLYEGLYDDGLKCIRAVRERFDGLKRNPYDEIECGRHYARSMASWSAVLALSGFHYSAVTGTMQITATPGTYFWSNGYAWGTIKVVEGAKPELNIIEGKLPLEYIVVGDRKYKI